MHEISVSRWSNQKVICRWKIICWLRNFATLYYISPKTKLYRISFIFHKASVLMKIKQFLDEVFVISRIIKVEVGVISRSRRLRLITLTETLIILDITKTESNNCFIIHWTQKLGSHVSASSLTVSNTSRAKLTWLPLEIMHCGHTWHDYSWPWHYYPWPWHGYCIICSYDVTGADFENSLYAFGQSEKS